MHDSRIAAELEPGACVEERVAENRYYGYVFCPFCDVNHHNNSCLYMQMRLPVAVIQAHQAV